MVTRNRLGPQGMDGPTVAVYHVPQTSDPRIPAAPTGLLSSPPPQVYQIRGGGYAAACSLTWTAPTKDTEGDPMEPASFQIWGRKGTATYAQLAIVTGTDTALTLEGFKPLEVWQFRVRVQTAMGKFSAYSNTVSITMPKNDPPPLPPSVPTGTSRLGTVSVTWDGKASGGGAMPPDIKHVLVQRCVRNTFTPATDITQVDQLSWAGTAVDGPLKVDDSWFYRFVAVDNAGQDSQPSGVFGPIVVQGIKGPDLPLNAITPGMLTKEVNDEIDEAARQAGLAADAAKGAAKIFSQPTKPTADMKLGDLWFDTSTATATTGGNKPYRFAATVPKPLGEWISIRDLTLNNAFPNGSLLAENFLDKDVIHTKFLQAGLIEAKDILSGTITAESGVIGSIDAGKITFGEMDGKYIRAGTITATSIFLGDTNNLIDQPAFADIAAWITGPPVGSIVTVADAPFVGSGKVYQITGNGVARNVENSRVIPVKPTEKFWSDCYVRKTATATTGTVAIVLVVKIKGSAIPTIVTIGQKTYTTADAANTWSRISGREIEIPANGYEASFALRIGGTVTSGNFQFAAPVLRRQFTGSLMVDGSITTDQLKANSIDADRLTAFSITTGKLDAGNINASVLKAGTVTTNHMTVGTIDGDRITVKTMHGNRIIVDTLNADRITSKSITTDQLATDAVYARNVHAGSINADKIASNAIEARHITTDSIGARAIVANTIKGGHLVANTIYSRELTTDCITSDELKANSIHSGHIVAGEIKAVNIAGNAITASKISSTAIDGKVITGATIRTKASGMRVQLSVGGLSLYDSSNFARVSISANTGSFYMRSSNSSSYSILDGSGFRIYSGGTNMVDLNKSGSAYFRGTISASNLTGSKYSGSINGTLSGGTISGSYHTGGSFGGSISNGATIAGGAWRSSNGGNRVEIAGDQIRLYSGGYLGGYVRGDPAASGVNIVPARGSVFLGSGTSGLQVTSTNYIIAKGIYNNTSTAGAAVYISASGFMTRHTSSARYKQKIQDLELVPGFLDIRTATWVDKPTPMSVRNRTKSKGTPRFTGFIAEDVQKCGLIDVVEYDQTNRPDGINVPALLAHTVRYVQSLVGQVGELTARVAELEGAK